MIQKEISELLLSIAVNWPSFKKQLFDGDRLVGYVVNEWYERVGFLSKQEADDLLERYMLTPEAQKYPPGIPWFLGVKKIRREKENVVVDYDIHGYHIGRWGELLDEYDREYGGSYGDGRPFVYYYNMRGDICRKSDTGTELVVVKWKDR
jgi:hypothetical protein